jgi:hypothetical protein
VARTGWVVLADDDDVTVVLFVLTSHHAGAVMTRLIADAVVQLTLVRWHPLAAIKPLHKDQLNGRRSQGGLSKRDFGPKKFSEAVT